MKKIEYNINNGDGYYRLYSFASSHKYKKDIIDIFDVSSFSRLIRNINSVSSNIDVADYEKGKSLEECQNSFIWFEWCDTVPVEYTSIFYCEKPEI